MRRLLLPLLCVLAVACPVMAQVILPDFPGGIPASALPGSFSGFANPSATIGLTATNGSATTAMRSDAAPALNQAITPTWTGSHIFRVNSGIGTSGPTWGTNADGVWALGSATAPTTSPVDVWQMWGCDVAGAGTFGLCGRDEGGNTFKMGNGQVIAPTGTVSLPAFADSTTPSTGIYFPSSNVAISVAGVERGRFTSAQFVLPSAASLGWNTAGADLVLERDAANIHAWRNGTNAQASRIYATFTDASNYERAALSATAGSGITLAAETAGTGGDNLDVAVTPAGTGDLRINKALVALGGGAAPTVGTIGGSGPATAAQNSWLQLKDSTGAVFWVPAWK